MSNTKPRVTVRLTPNQLLVLEELKSILNCNISLLIRAIVGSWLVTNEDVIYEILEGKRDFNKDWLNNKEKDIEEDAIN